MNNQGRGPDQTDQTKSGTINGQQTIKNEIEGQQPYDEEVEGINNTFLKYAEQVAPYYAGRQVPSQQTIYSRNSFATTDPVMKKFGVNVAQDGVAEFIPQVNMSTHDHLFDARMKQQDNHQKLLQVNAQIPDEYKKEFYGPSHFYEGVPDDFNIRMMHIKFRRQRENNFYAFV